MQNETKDIAMQVGKLSTEMKEVKTAANLSLDRVHSSLKELERGVEIMNTEIDEVGAISRDLADPFLEVMVTFARDTKVEVDNLQVLAATSLGKLKDVAAYFGETIKEERQTELFKTMREFLFMFDCVCNEIKNVKKRSANDVVAKSNHRQLRFVPRESTTYERFTNHVRSRGFLWEVVKNISIRNF
jgi:hypothetical protein